MRSFIPILLVLACPIGMCVIPMLFMRRRGVHAQAHESSEQQLREENARLRAKPDKAKESSSR